MSTRRRYWLLALSLAFALIALAWASRPPAPAGQQAHAADAQQCADPYPATRDPSNPLDLPTAPGADPLTGANFFVDGPAHGEAAGAIEKLLGLNPSRLPGRLFVGPLRGQPRHGQAAPQAQPAITGLAHKVALLSKLAAEPEAQRFSLYSAGGGPGAIFAQVQKIFCHNMTADPGSIPIITTYFLYQAGYCESSSEIIDHRPTFERQVNEMVAGIENRPAVMLLELDAIGSSSCMARSGALPEWEADMRYEINAAASLPHTVVYIEGGYSDGNSPAYTAQVLNAVGVSSIRGFFTNDTHLNWTINEIKWGEKVSALTGGSHFIINTADNGRGPKPTRTRSSRATRISATRPARRRPADDHPDRHPARRRVHVDARARIAAAGTCNGGTPSGTFFLARGLTESANANARSVRSIRAVRTRGSEGRATAGVQWLLRHAAAAALPSRRPAGRRRADQPADPMSVRSRGRSSPRRRASASGYDGHLRWVRSSRGRIAGHRACIARQSEPISAKSVAVRTHVPHA